MRKLILAAALAFPLAAHGQEAQTYDLRGLTAQQVNQIFSLLIEQRFKDVAPLIYELQRQIDAQNAASGKK